MKRLAFLIALVAGCSQKPCAVTSECGNGEACVAAHCQALSCSDTVAAVNPATGSCTPLSGCVDHGAVEGWPSCDDPCAGLGESACKTQPACQATYTTDGKPFGCGDTLSCPVPGTFRGCRGVPQLIDPCLALDASGCQSDSRCELAPQPGCACAGGGGSVDGGVGVGGVCDCGGNFPACRLKACQELSGDACSARPDCTSSPVFVTPVASGGSSSGTAQPKLAPQPGCFFLGGCNGVGERDCLMQRACAPLYLADGGYAGCTAQDFTRHCTSVADCNSDERCSADGRCVTAGCGGENEAECNADLYCEPIYALSCSPYANGPGGGGLCGPNGAGGGAPLPNEA
ncbi:MAG: hypothetical protein JWM53_466, partial [bacterium]|nr:hypothetical protein [bacterium]